MASVLAGTASVLAGTASVLAPGTASVLTLDTTSVLALLGQHVLYVMKQTRAYHQGGKQRREVLSRQRLLQEAIPLPSFFGVVALASASLLHSRYLACLAYHELSQIHMKSLRIVVPALFFHFLFSSKRSQDFKFNVYIIFNFVLPTRKQYIRALQPERRTTFTTLRRSISNVERFLQATLYQYSCFVPIARFCSPHMITPCDSMAIKAAAIAGSRSAFCFCSSMTSWRRKTALSGEMIIVGAPSVVNAYPVTKRRSRSCACSS